LAFKIGFGCSIGAAPNLSGHKQQITGSDSGGIAVLLVEGVPISRKDCFALGHSDLSLLLATTDEREATPHKLAHHLIYGTYLEYPAYGPYVKYVYASYVKLRD
jgi:hypothetical protein